MQGIRERIWREVMGDMRIYVDVKKDWSQADGGGKGKLKQAEKMKEYGWWAKWWLRDLLMVCKAT